MTQTLLKPRRRGLVLSKVRAAVQSSQIRDLLVAWPSMLLLLLLTLAPGPHIGSPPLVTTPIPIDQKRFGDEVPACLNTINN